MITLKSNFSDAESSNHLDFHPKQSTQDEILIDFLIKHPCLYDKSDREFRNRSLKELKWKEVANKINMGGIKNVFNKDEKKLVDYDFTKH